MATTEAGTGWLPTEAQDDLEQSRDKASEETAERLLSLSPRERVVELLALATTGEAGDFPVRLPDLIRVLASFEGQEMPDADRLRERIPSLATPRSE